MQNETDNSFSFHTFSIKERIIYRLAFRWSVGSGVYSPIFLQHILCWISFYLIGSGIGIRIFLFINEKTIRKSRYQPIFCFLHHNARWRTLCLKTLPQMIKPLLKHFLIRFLAGFMVYVIAFVQYYFLDMMALITFLYGAILYFLYLLGELLYYSFARYDYGRAALNAFTIILHYLLYYL